MAGCRTHGLAVEFTDLTYKGKRTHDLPVKVTNSLQTACTYTQKGRVVPKIIILLSKQISWLEHSFDSVLYSSLNQYYNNKSKAWTCFPRFVNIILTYLQQ